MKIASIKLISILFAIPLLISSCGSISISQKRYSNGLNISLFAGKDNEKPRTTKVYVKNTETSVASKIDNKVDNIDLDNVDVQDVTIENEVTAQVQEMVTVNPNAQLQVSKEYKVSVKSDKKAIKANFKDLKGKIQKTVRAEKLSPTSVDQTHGSGLATVGWILIILGLIFLLIINIIVGLLIMLVGLLFVING